MALTDAAKVGVKMILGQVPQLTGFNNAEREQLIGEVNGIERFVNLVEAEEEKLRELIKQNEESKSNEK